MAKNPRIGFQVRNPTAEATLKELAAAFKESIPEE